MNRAIYYTQECSTCGRRLEIRVELLGRRVECPHCHGQFVAQDPNSLAVQTRDSQAITQTALFSEKYSGPVAGGDVNNSAQTVPNLAWMARAEALLSMGHPSRAAS